MNKREDKEVEKVKKCLNWFAKNIPKAAPDLLALAGGYLIAQGAWMIYPPAFVSFQPVFRRQRSHV